MNLEELREFCLQLPHVTEETPFGPDTLVFKVGGKLFLLTPFDSESFQFNVKCDPEFALELREQYEGLVIPGYHMNKKHWNTILPNHKISANLLKEWIRHSYDLVVKSLTKQIKVALAII